MSIQNALIAADEWNTKNSLAIELLYNQLIYPHRYAMPTLRLLFQNMKRDKLGPDMKFGWNVVTKNFSPSLGSKAQVWNAPGLDNLTRMEYQPSIMFNSAGTNDVDVALYDSPLARLNFIKLMVDSMHQGFTDAFAYEIFSAWDENIDDNSVDITAALSNNPNPPQELTLGNVTRHARRMYSIPMLIREPQAGHTLANIEVTTTQNPWWHPTVQTHPSATATPSASGDNIDVITDVTNPQPADLDDFSEWFDLIQVGWQYGLYVCVGSGLYRQLVALLLAITRRDIGSPLGELGIRASIEWQDYNAIFYKDPMMTWLHPYSAFAWDPEVLFLLTDMRFDPTRGSGIYPWERISGGNLQATAMYMISQLCTPDRRGLGALHGYTKS
ncbi:MAG: hypothetical protein ACW99G_01615 [Candidatus Thorarchaeota archaeon]|jgi:hypothetical protein